MVLETVEAGLDHCDLRMRYRENRSSTPTRARICSNDNADCWGAGGYNEPSKIATPTVTMDSNSESDILPQLVRSLDEDDVIEVNAGGRHEVDTCDRIDLSYDGAWSVFPNSPPSPPPPSPPLSTSPNSFGISVFDQYSDQVLANNDIRVLESRKKQANPIAQNALCNLENIKSELREHTKESMEATQDILELNVCHVKTNHELKVEKRQNHDYSNFRNENLRILLNNVRGFFSKRESFEAILAREEVDIACVCETFMSGTSYPELPGFVTYFRNRKARAAGGVAILIKEERARYAVKLDVGLDQNEFFVIKFTNCNPHLVIVIYYGNQRKVGVDQIKLHLSQLLDAVKKYTSQGCNVNVLGDFNLQTGNSVIKNNHPESDPTGRLFLDQIDILGLEIMNNRSSNPITFVDRSGKDHRRVVLDLVLSNMPDTINNFKTDDEKLEFTPYSIHKRKGSTYRTYADHFSVMYQVSTMWQDRTEFIKEPIWNYKKLLGNVKFDLFTSNACNFLMNKIETASDINDVHKAFVKVITKGKFQSYGRRSLTVTKLKKVNDELVWRQRLSDLDKLEKQFSEEKENDRIYKTRKVIVAGQRDRQNVAVEVDGTGEVLEDLDDVLDHVLEYNVKNMDKVVPSKQVEEVMRRKAAVIDMMLEDEQVEQFPNEIPWEIFLNVLEKVIRQKKACFRDIIKSGRNFKYALYKFLNRMYKNEEFPAISAITYLTRLWKRKGSQALLKNNRFIHGKEPISKILEKCVVAIIAEKIDAATPQLQAGSRKGRSTRDQLLKVIVMQKYSESKSKPLPILLVDVRACFDRMVLSDVVYDTIQSGADLKAVRVVSKFSEKTEIRLKGDHRNEGKGVGRVITGTLGQGSNFAPPGIGMTTSISLSNQFSCKGDIMAKIGDVTTDPQSYVDDMATMPANEKGLKEASSLIGKALEDISLQSHPEKTEVIISGRNKRAAAMRENLVQRPAMMQGHPVKVAESGMYLGMKVSQEGHKDTIDLTVRHRVAKAWGRVAEIKSNINDVRMSRMGWLRAGILLIRSVIIPSVSYSGDVWLAMNRVTEKYLIDEYKSMMYVILDIPTHTKWTSVLADLNLPNIMSIIDKLRINFLNHTLWGRGDIKLKEMLLEEHKLNPNNSLVSNVDRICAKYGIPNVSMMQLDRFIIKRKIKLGDEIDIWIDNIKSPVTQNVGLERVRLSTNFFRLSKRESQALIAFHAGAFKLKTSWGRYHEVQDCLVPLCGGRDELEHIKRCQFYKAKWDDKFEEDCLSLSKYLVEVDRERRRRWKGECLF